MRVPTRILVVEDNEFDRLLVSQELENCEFPCQTHFVDNSADFILGLMGFKPDLVLCDFSLPQFSAIEALQLLQARASQIPLVIVTGCLTDEVAVTCLQKGAADYVIKEKLVRLPSVIKRTLELASIKRERESAEKQLKVITDVLPASLAYISKDFHFKFGNAINDLWFGSDIIGKPVQDVFGAKVFSSIQEVQEKLFAGIACSFESALPGPVAPQFVNVTIVPDLDKKAQVQGFVCLIADITLQKNYENELHKAKDEAESANNAKSQFLANMSHEMRTPLNVIGGLAELLLRNKPNEEERTVWIKKIGLSCEHLRKVIDEVLDLSKIEAGKLQIEKSRFPLIEVISQVKSMLLPLATVKGLELKFALEGAVPEHIESDSMKLRHILLNLVGNAIKFSLVGPITLSMRLKKEELGEKLVFLIKDNGPGINPQQAQQLFKPFTQADNSMTRKFGGTGLGLVLAKRFAQGLGGDVELLESVVNEGSTFALTIDPGDVKNEPALLSLQTVLEPTYLDMAVPNMSINLKGLRALLVEDSVDNQFLIQQFLKTEGVTIDVALDGQEGMQKALAADYDVILMDIQMPVLDGYSATTKLRHQGYAKPIVAFTAHAFTAEKERCMKAGFNDFLTKPVKKIELLSCINKYKNPSGKNYARAG